MSGLIRATFPSAVHPLVAGDGSEVASRLQWLRDGMVLDITRHAQAYEHPYPHPPWRGAGSRHARILATTDDRLTAQRRQIEDLNARIRRLERTSIAGLLAAAVRRLRRRFAR